MLPIKVITDRTIPSQYKILLAGPNILDKGYFIKSLTGSNLHTPLSSVFTNITVLQVNTNFNIMTLSFTEHPSYRTLEDLVKLEKYDLVLLFGDDTRKLKDKYKGGKYYSVNMYSNISDFYCDFNKREDCTAMLLELLRIITNNKALRYYNEGDAIEDEFDFCLIEPNPS